MFETNTYAVLDVPEPYAGSEAGGAPAGLPLVPLLHPSVLASEA